MTFKKLTESPLIAELRTCPAQVHVHGEPPVAVRVERDRDSLGHRGHLLRLRVRLRLHEDHSRHQRQVHLGVIGPGGLGDHWQWSCKSPLRSVERADYIFDLITFPNYTLIYCRYY